MLTKKVLQKMFITSSLVVIILLIYLMPGVTFNSNEITTTTNYVDLNSYTVYLEDDNELLVEVSISMIDSEIVDIIKSLINNLSMASSEIIPNGLNGVMKDDIELLDVNIDENLVDLNFSKEFINQDEKDVIRLVEAISFTLLDLEEVNGVSFYVEGTLLNELVNYDIPNIITKDFGINKKFEINSMNDIMKYVIYYMEEIDDVTYYVPITKYINSSSNKIDVIIEDLSSNYIYESNLISLVSGNLEIVGFDVSDSEVVLNFNSSDIIEEVTYPVINTILSNYDVTTVKLEVDGEVFYTNE